MELSHKREVDKRQAKSRIETAKPVKTPLISEAVLKEFDVLGPRYTSYPTADRFVEAFDEQAYLQALDKRANTAGPQPLSLYIHIPFCESLCFYCACNKIVTKHHEKSESYLEHLYLEMDMNLRHLGARQSVAQLHLGGGTPTFLSDIELTELMTKLQRSFVLTSEGEYSIEIDPRTVNQSRLKYLAALGFNRLSFGVQDFDEEVQRAVHRIQPTSQVFDLMEAARRHNFESVNVDLIYGLPKQTRASFSRTIRQVVALRPDRIALYAYAHLPDRFKPQRRIQSADLPDAATKVAMLSDAIQMFLDAGYVYVGMDHFALPNDALAVAKRQGRLHRNFQGYTTRPDCDLLGLGVSSISKIGTTYSQNAKTLEEYYDHLNHGHLPVVRGLALGKDDIIRRAVIMALMCQGGVEYESIELSFMLDFKQYFASELIAIKPLELSGLVTVDDHGIEVTETGWFFVRGIAMLFDRYLQQDKNLARYSKII